MKVASVFNYLSHYCNSYQTAFLKATNSMSHLTFPALMNATGTVYFMVFGTSIEHCNVLIVFKSRASSK